MGTLLYDSETLGLRLDLVHNPLDEFGEDLQNLSDIPSAKLLDLPERYLKGGINRGDKPGDKLGTDGTFTVSSP